LDILVLERHRR